MSESECAITLAGDIPGNMCGMVLARSLCTALGDARSHDSRLQHSNESNESNASESMASSHDLSAPRTSKNARTWPDRTSARRTAG